MADRQPKPWLLLDLAGVLLRFDPDARFARLAEAGGPAPEAARARIEADGIGARLDTGRADETELATLLSAIAARALGVDEAWAIWFAAFEPEPDRFAALGALADRWRLGLFTNNVARIATLFDAAPFERMFFSSELGVTKPDPESYARVARALDADPAAITFVDDGRANVEAARDAGWNAILFETGHDLARL